MTPTRFVLAAALPLALTACGVPDLVAHGVKSYERTQDANRAAENNQPPAAYQPAPAPAAYQPAPKESDFVPAPAPQRESITAEPLK